MLLLLLACAGPAAVGVTDSASGGGNPAGDWQVPGTNDDSLGAFLYQTTEILDFGLTIDSASLAALEAAPREDVVATFTYQDTAYEVMMHLKGTTSFESFDGKPAIKIDFHDIVEDATFNGVRRLTLNNMLQDGSMSAEHASYRLYALLGLPAPRHGYATLTINDELYGLYGIVETMDEQFIDRWWPNDDNGNLYEGEDGTDLYHYSPDHMQVQEVGEPEDGSDLVAMIEALDAATDATFLDTISALFDLDALLLELAIELVVANQDGYISTGNNFLVYHAPDADQWWMIPWGTDQTFYENDPLYHKIHGRIAVSCLAVPTCQTQLEDAVQTVLDTWDQRDLSGFVAAETARIEDACRSDPRSWWGDYGCKDRLEEARVYAETRTDELRAEMGW